MIKATYGIDHLFLPPYSPFLNPIELSFNAIKTDAKSREMQDRGELLDSIERSIKSVVNAENSNKWYSHCVRFYQQCAMGLPFTGLILDPEITDPNGLNQQQQIQSTNLITL
jgi:hypothetical protein